MNAFLAVDIYLYIVLFVTAGLSGVFVKIDQWVEGDYYHPRLENGKLDIWKSFWMYLLTFVFSGVSGVIASIFLASISNNEGDIRILLAFSVLLGAIGKVIFYRMVDYVHNKVNASLEPETKRSRRGRQ